MATANNKINVTLILPILLGGVLTSNESNLKMVDIEEQVTHWLLTLTERQNIVLQAVIGANFFTGNLFRYLLFKQVWNDGRLTKPVNIMIGIFVRAYPMPIMADIGFCV